MCVVLEYAAIEAQGQYLWVGPKLDPVVDRDGALGVLRGDGAAEEQQGIGWYSGHLADAKRCQG